MVDRRAPPARGEHLEQTLPRVPRVSAPPHAVHTWALAEGGAGLPHDRVETSSESQPRGILGDSLTLPSGKGHATGPVGGHRVKADIAPCLSPHRLHSAALGPSLRNTRPDQSWMLVSAVGSGGCGLLSLPLCRPSWLPSNGRPAPGSQPLSPCGPAPPGFRASLPEVACEQQAGGTGQLASGLASPRTWAQCS